MNRCEHCQRYETWECWDVTSDEKVCERFKLDFDTLNVTQKKNVQLWLMEGIEDE